MLKKYAPVPQKELTKSLRLEVSPNGFTLWANEGDKRNNHWLIDASTIFRDGTFEVSNLANEDCTENHYSINVQKTYDDLRNGLFSLIKPDKTS